MFITICRQVFRQVYHSDPAYHLDMVYILDQAYPSPLTDLPGLQSVLVQDYQFSICGLPFLDMGYQFSKFDLPAL